MTTTTTTMMVREKKEITASSLLLKLGCALALSLGGVVYSIIRTKRMRPSGELGDDSHALQPDKHALCRPRVTIDASISGLSPTVRSCGDKDVFLLPEFDDLVKDVDTDEEVSRGCKCIEMDYREQEIKSLRNKVKILKERERTLEIQLLEYYGLKEQETAVMELQNRLKINNVEAKLFNLKIESLQADNKRLEAHVADYTKVVTDLEAARSKIKLLKRKFRSESEQHKEKISTLQKKVTNLQDNEHEAVAIDPNTQSKPQKLKDLENEVEELRKSNYSLRIENTDLAEKLEYVQILATSVLEDQEIEKLKEETQQLRKQNENLTKEIEQLRGYRCADVEELVYLRWVNACLRYELRNYQPANGKTIARDLSKTLSPKSEEKARQLILEYANKEGEKGTNISEIDFDQWSSSQASFPTDPGELDESLVENSSTNRSSNTTKRKFFSKLKNLLRGKDGRHHSSHSRGSSEERNDYNEDESPLRNSSISTGSDQNNRSRNSSQGSSRRSLDIPRSSPCIPRLKSAKSEGIDDSLQDQDAHKSNVRKYADALKDSRGRKSPKLPRRSASFSSF
ncbi:hypothetical protein LguiB_008381 [Lonicera macranthoides]